MAAEEENEAAEMSERMAKAEEEKEANVPGRPPASALAEACLL